jgi:hypothetical protein
MTLNDAYLTLGRQITDLANKGKIDGHRSQYYRRAGAARALLAAAASGDFSKALSLGKALSAPILTGPAMGKDWRPVAELAYRLGRQVARNSQQTSNEKAVA